MKARMAILVFIMLSVCLIPTSCTNEPESTDDLKSDPYAIDYSKSEHWLSLPASIDKSVDVFYLYPTAWQKIAPSDSNICEIDNPMMLKYSELAFKRQATAFETVANIYAPYYRQVDAITHFALSAGDQIKDIGGTPTADVVAAFDYYIKHYNNGRPFILAGHSQGANVLANLLSGYMKDNPQVYNRMIAAYVIGYSITHEYLAQNPHLKFAVGPDDVGVIISYNTEAPDVVKGTNVLVLPDAVVINPITWTRDETLAAASENLGSITVNPDGTVADGLAAPVMNYADAKVDKDKGVIICSTVDEDKLSPGSSLLTRGVYHSFDYTFYYYDIRANAANRTAKFLGK